MNNYCINLKKRKNKPYCKIKNKEINLSQCKECDSKEYKKGSAKFSAKLSAKVCEKKSTSIKKSLVASGQTKPAKLRNKSNKLAKLEKNRYSVFAKDLEHCYLCGKKKNDLHEVYAGRNRINSIKYGFVLPLCRECHSLNQNNPFFNDYWHKQGQLYWEEFIGMREEFIEVFRINYLK